MAIPGQFTILNVRQSILAAKPPNSMSTKCTAPMVYPIIHKMYVSIIAI